MTRLVRTAPAPKPGIVHLGPGAFFRAFLGTYTQDVVDQIGGDWGVIAVSLQSTWARDQLQPQGCIYHAVTMAADGPRAQRIGIISDILVAPEDPAAVIAAMADPATKIVSLTITEKGYGYAPARPGLDIDMPNIASDLQCLMQPKSALGFIVSALEKRRLAGLPSFTVLSCDNLPANGELTRKMVLEFAALLDNSDLVSWIAANARFPSTMVDRITPATTQADIDRIAEGTGVRDEALVLHEPFRQWVIEDDFVAGRPNWELAGAQFVGSVEAHELMKLRCLNGTHSALSYLGYLAGHETIADAVGDPIFADFCKYLWVKEILPTLPQPEGEDLTAYTEALMQRYQNPAIRHRTWQIAMDGSQKLPQRILGTMADNLAAGHEINGLALVVAGWMRYVGGVDEQGNEIDVRDPMADRLRDAHKGDAAGNLMEIKEIFPRVLADDERFRKAVARAYTRISAVGARAAVKELL